MKFVTILGVTTLMVAGTALADDARVGQRVSTPAGTVRVDTSPRGDTTVRPDSTSGPSITLGSEPRTRSNPHGDTRATVGYSWEF